MWVWTRVWSKTPCFSLYRSCMVSTLPWLAEHWGQPDTKGDTSLEKCYRVSGQKLKQETWEEAHPEAKCPCQKKKRNKPMSTPGWPLFLDSVSTERAYSGTNERHFLMVLHCIWECFSEATNQKGNLSHRKRGFGVTFSVQGLSQGWHVGWEMGEIGQMKYWGRKKAPQCVCFVPQ